METAEAKHCRTSISSLQEAGAGRESESRWDATGRLVEELTT